MKGWSRTTQDLPRPADRNDAGQRTTGYGGYAPSGTPGRESRVGILEGASRIVTSIVVGVAFVGLWAVIKMSRAYELARNVVDR